MTLTTQELKDMVAMTIMSYLRESEGTCASGLTPTTSRKPSRFSERSGKPLSEKILKNLLTNTSLNAII